MGQIRENSLYLVYHCHQIVNTEVNNFYRYTTFHLAGALLVTSFTAFALIELPGKVQVQVIVAGGAVFVMAVLVLGYVNHTKSESMLVHNY